MSRKGHGGLAKFGNQREIGGMVINMSDMANAANRMIGALDTAEFVTTMDKALQQFVDFDLSAVLQFSPGAKPVLLHNGLGGISSSQVMANYLNATYLLDAVYVACARRIEPGLYRLSQLAPDEFFSSGYYVSPEVHPCISLESGTLAEEITFIAMLSPATYACYSLMRSSHYQPFSDAEMACLQQFVPVVNALMMKQWRGPETDVDASVEPQTGELEHAFASFADATLSRREQMIVSFILRGHSSLSIAHVLDIAEGTVKNHRKHIYAKLEISSQGELFKLFLAHVLGKR
jgi:DNA-binding CsgD family transcriptional regulator